MMIDRRLVREAAPGRTFLMAAVALGVASGVCAVAQGLACSRAIDLVLLRSARTQDLRGALAVLTAAIVARALLTWASDAAAGRAAAAILAQLRTRLVAHITSGGTGAAVRSSSADTAAALTDGIDAMEPYFSQFLPGLALAGFVPAIVLAAVLDRDPLSAAILFATGPLIPVFMALIGTAADGLAHRQWQTLGRLSARFQDALEGLTTLKLLGQSEQQADALERSGEAYREATLAVMRIAFISALALELLSTLSTAVVAVEIGLRLLYGRIAFAPAFAVLVLAPEFYAPLRALGARFHASATGLAASRRVFAILDAPVPADATGRIAAEPAAAPAGGAIRVDHVTFTYPGAAAPALDDVCVEIPAGALVAIVGRNGAGKSTLAAAILGMIRPDLGTITSGGAPIDAMPAAEWRSRIGWVAQDPYIYHESVAGNLRRGRPDASDTEMAVAARAAGIDGFVRAMPGGYAAVVGEGGARLSAGQRQRIAIARALLKAPRVLVLDEPTSHLDADTEAAFGRTMAARGPGVTALVIAHRLHTCVAADRIIVLEGGRVAETGTHAELVAAGGAYAAMVAATHGGQPQPTPARTPSAKPASATAVPAAAAVPAPAEPAQAVAVPVPSAPPASAALPASAEPAQAVAVPAPAATPPCAPGSACATAPPHATALPASAPGPARADAGARPSGRVIGLLRPFARAIAGAAALSLTTAGANVALMACSAYIIASAAFHPGVETLALAIVGVRFFGIARGLSRYAERLVSHDATLRLVAHLRTAAYRSIEPHVPGIWVREKRADWIARLVSDVDALQNLIVRVVIPAVTAAASALVGALVLGLVHPGLAACAVALAALGGVVIPAAIGRAARTTDRAMPVARGALGVLVTDLVAGLPDLLMLGGEREQSLRIAAADRGYRRIVAAAGAWQSAAGSLAGLCGHLSIPLTIAILAGPAAHGAIAAVLVPTIALGLAASFEPVIAAAAAWQHAAAGAASLQRVCELQAAATMPNHCPAPAMAGEWPGGDLAATGVRFRYTPGDAEAVAGVSLRAHPGQMVAIVGPSGCGKSTLIALMARLYEWDAGDITLGGASLREATASAARAELAAASHDAHVFDATIRQNVLLARPDAAQDELDAAARASGLAVVLAQMERGWDTPVGEHGSRLSGGERRRIVLARALLQRSRAILLDEVTASFDPLTEMRVLADVRAAASDRALVVTSHRLAAIAGADEIIVMDEGRVVDHGPHAELMERPGLYRRQWDLQAIGLA